MHLLQKKKQFQPYKVKETWTHEFCVLADKDQCKVPTTSMKQELKRSWFRSKEHNFQEQEGQLQ